MSAYIRCMGCYEDTMDIDSLICSECGYESGMSEIKALSTRIADLERQIAAVTAERDALKSQAGTLATAFRVNMLRLSPKITHEEIDKVLADVAQKAVDAEREMDALRVDAEKQPASYIDYQQRNGAPLTFFTTIAVEAFNAAATRDDVSVHEAMRAALEAIDAARGAK